MSGVPKSTRRNITQASDGYFKRKRDSKSQITYKNDQNKLPVSSKFEAAAREKHADHLVAGLGRKGADSA